MTDGWQHYVGKHESDITSIKEDVTEMKQDLKLVSNFIIERKAEKKLGYAVLSAIMAVGAYVGQYIPTLIDWLKATGK